MLRAIIIDDEPKGRSILQQLIALHAPQLNIVAMAANADEGLEIIDSYKPDVVFLDVEMPEVQKLSYIYRIIKKC